MTSLGPGSLQDLGVDGGSLGHLERDPNWTWTSSCSQDARVGVALVGGGGHHHAGTELCCMSHAGLLGGGMQWGPRFHSQ